MKKVLPFFLSFFLFLNFALPTQIHAYEEAVDQQNTTISQSSLTIYNYGHNQTFTPSVNVLTKAQVYVKDRVGGANITMRIRNEENGLTVVNTTQRMGSGTGWEVFNFVGDSLGYIVSVGTIHSIWIETDYFPTDAPKWVRSNTNAYANGNRRQGATSYPGDDFAFATYGYSNIAPDPEPDPDPTPLPDDDTTDDEADTDTTDQTETQENTTDGEDTEIMELDDEGNPISISGNSESGDNTDSNGDEGNGSNESDGTNWRRYAGITLIVCASFWLIIIAIVFYMYKKNKIRKEHIDQIRRKLNTHFAKLNIKI